MSSQVLELNASEFGQSHNNAFYNEKQILRQNEKNEMKQFSKTCFFEVIKIDRIVAKLLVLNFFCFFSVALKIVLGDTVHSFKASQRQVWLGKVREKEKEREREDKTMARDAKIISWFTIENATML